MAKLYIANCTKHNQELHYWASEVTRPMRQIVPMGQQVQVFRDAPREELEHIVTQLRRYGLVEAPEADRMKGFVGMCFSFDTPVGEEKIYGVMEKNDVVLDQKSQEYRTEAAVALNAQVEQNLKEMGVSATLNSLEVGLQEEAKVGDNSAKMEETILVSKKNK